MKTGDRLRLAMAVLLAAVVACDDDDDGDNGTATEFEALLTGEEEVPPVPTLANGTAAVAIDGSQIVYRVEVSQLENAVVAHIHVAPPGENGPVRMNLCGTGAPLPACVSDGVLAEGANATAVGITFDSLVSAMRAGNAYVNVHTDDGVGEQNTGPGDMASGEIRGQLEPQ
jgi:CHRD domain